MNHSLTASPVVASSDLEGRYLTFTLGGDNYAIPVMNVREIIHMCPITPVRRMPDYVKGVINLRGSVIVVIDLRLKFAMSPTDYNERTCIIVVHVRGAGGERDTLMGAIVDTVEEVVMLSDGDIGPTPDFGVPHDTQYMLGVSTVNGSVKTLLDIERIFREEGVVELIAADPNIANLT
ncbi:MAG: chemotaxis protein CheW [Novosphingobium sp.]|uniref:chemotaxis protein CheW n=1 Tax=Novosphingobium sp. TaxID=1874826 RepID=UPI0030199BFD